MSKENEMTPAMKLKAIAKIKMEREANRGIVRLFLEGEEHAFNEELKLALVALTGCYKQGRASQSSLNDVLRQRFIDYEFIKGFDLYEEYELGGSEMAKKIRSFIKDFPESERIYVQKVGKDYQLMSVGFIPENWTGYRVIVEETL